MRITLTTEQALEAAEGVLKNLHKAKIEVSGFYNSISDGEEYFYKVTLPDTTEIYCFYTDASTIIPFSETQCNSYRIMFSMTFQEKVFFDLNGKEEVHEVECGYTNSAGLHSGLNEADEKS